MMKLTTSLLAVAASFFALVLLLSSSSIKGIQAAGPQVLRSSSKTNAAASGGGGFNLTDVRQHHQHPYGFKKPRIPRQVNLGRPRRRLTKEEYRRELSAYENYIINLWTPEKRAAAIPMDLRVLEDPDHKHERFLQALENNRGGTEGMDVDNSSDEGANGGDVEGDDEGENYRWSAGGPMQQVSGRIFMIFDENAFSCSGTVVRDNGTPDRTLIATAAHCIYNEMRRYWAHDFLFIPNQDDGGEDESNHKCDDDPFGCWVPAFGVVDTDWAKNLNNIPHDYGFLVVPNQDSHKGNGGGETWPMEDAVQAIKMDLTDKMNLQTGDSVTAMGLPGYEHNELRYATGNVKIWNNLLFVPGGKLTEGASGGSIVTDPTGDPTLIGFNVFKAGWWKPEEDGDGYKFIQTACGGPPLWGDSFCSLAHVAENYPLDDQEILDEGGIIHEWDGSQCLIPGICTNDEDCNDGQFCNGVESCVAGACVASDTVPCTGLERCDEKRDVCMPPCAHDRECNNGIWCDGVEKCVDGQCQAGEPPCGAGTYCDPFENECKEVECVSDYDCDDGRFCTGEEQCKKGQCVSGFDPCDKRGGEVCVETIEACPLATCSGVPDFCIDEYRTTVCCHCVKHCNQPFEDTVVMECAPELFFPLPYAGFRNPPMCWTLLFPPGSPQISGRRLEAETFEFNG